MQISDREKRYLRYLLNFLAFGSFILFFILRETEYLSFIDRSINPYLIGVFVISALIKFVTRTVATITGSKKVFGRIKKYIKRKREEKKKEEKGDE